MKTRQILSLVAGLALAAGFAPQAAAASKAAAPEDVTVTFQDSDKFTDVRENRSEETSQYFLGQLKECLQQNAAPLLAAGQKLAITVTDVDLAGETRLNQPNEIRVMKEIYFPRAHLKFQLLGADGKVLKEGERKLQDMDYLMQAGRPGSQEPLYYDKQLLAKWARDEFRSRS